MSLLHKTNSVLNLSKINENNALSYKYSNINSFESVHNYQSTNYNSTHNSITNINNNKEENSIINNNINNIYNNISQEFPFKKNKIIFSDVSNNENYNYNYNDFIKKNNNITTQEFLYQYPHNNKKIFNNDNFNDFSKNNNIIINQDLNFQNNSIIDRSDKNYNNFFQNNNNNYYSSINTLQDLDFKNEAFSKIIEENNFLKEKLKRIESENNSNKNESERHILIIKDENSKLQLEIQKFLEKEKISYNKYQNDLKEKKSIINNLQNIINELKAKIKLLSNENISLLNNIHNLNNKIIGLTNDKHYLIDEMSELNKDLSNKIKPKLMRNEDNLSSLEKQIVLLKINNDILKDNDREQKQKISNLIKENKMLRQNLEKFNLIKNIEDLTIKTINNKRKKSANDNTKKYSSCKILYKAADKNIKKGDIINGGSLNNHYGNKKIKHCQSEKSLTVSDYENFKNSYNRKGKNNNKKRNISNVKCMKTSYKKNNNSKENLKNKILYYNTIIKKRSSKNKNQNKKENIYGTKLKMKNNGFNIKLEKIDDINNKENYLFYNINNLTESRSLLSSYSEE